MDRFHNALKLYAGRMDARLAQPRFGIVTSIDAERFTARVIIQPEGVRSGWLPVLSQWIGAGWGMMCLPEPGDQVLVLPQEGAAEHGVIVGRAYSDERRPLAAPAGEFWLVHKSGSFFKLTNDGSIRIKGDVHVDGEIHDRLGALGHLRARYNQHTHVDPHGGVTSTPSPEDKPA